MSAADQGRTSTAEGQGTRDPEQIREEIEETRVELGETVSEVAAKTDVKGQAQAKADELKEQAGAKAEDVQRVARENPMPIAIGGAFLAGMVVGRLISR
jgi:ElaB/YqjD/DUF883 family membrane-anchored ribosome-binding protein